MAQKILITEEIVPAGIEILKEKGYEVDCKFDLSREELLDIIEDYDALIVRSATKVDREIFEIGKKLRVVGRAGVGIDNIDIEAANAYGVIVCNAPVSNTVSAAEHTMALMLAAARNVAAADACMKAGGWNRRDFTGTELYHKTLAIFGLGRIGGLVADRAHAFGMEVIAYDPYCSRERAGQLGVTLYDTIEDVLPRADFITVHTPATDETIGMFGPEEFSQMKDGVILVNVAQGGIYDVKALSDFVAAGKVAACGIEMDRNRNNVVLSRRVLLEEGRKNERAEILEKLSKGMRLKGTVSSIVDFGAFVDLGGIDGLIHISELSWSHVNHPSEVVKVNEEVEVEVLDVDLQRERISLGLKQTTEDPWIKLVEVYPVDTIVDGRVTKIVPFGAFIELGDNVEGLVHISEMAMKHIDSPNQVVSVGDEVKVKVMDVNTDRRRISLSMKAAAEDLGIEIDVDEPEPKEEAEDAE